MVSKPLVFVLTGKTLSTSIANTLTNFQVQYKRFLSLALALYFYLLELLLVRTNYLFILGLLATVIYMTGVAQVFQSLDSDPSLAKTLDSQTPVASSLELKVGTQVMLTKNMDVTRGLVNGARGVITGFKNGGEGKRNKGKVPLIDSGLRFRVYMLRFHCLPATVQLRALWEFTESSKL